MCYIKEIQWKGDLSLSGLRTRYTPLNKRCAWGRNGQLARGMHCKTMSEGFKMKTPKSKVIIWTVSNMWRHRGNIPLLQSSHQFSFRFQWKTWIDPKPNPKVRPRLFQMFQTCGLKESQFEDSRFCYKIPPRFVWLMTSRRCVLFVLFLFSFCEHQFC